MTNTKSYQRLTAHRLIQLGMVLFLFGLLTGFAIPAMANPRAGLTSHLEGVMNGMFLAILGLVWPRLKLGVPALRTAYWLALIGTYINWASTGLSGLLGAGEKLMPIASAGHQGTPAQELAILIGLLAVSIAMPIVIGIALWGLRHTPSGDA